MENECCNLKRNGDCITRDAKTLCEFCDSLLSDDEKDHREIALFVAAHKLKARYDPGDCCLTLRKTDKRNCREKNLSVLCCWCSAQMTDKQLAAYATKQIKQRNKERAFWADREEAEAYCAELKESDAVGIDWNIEQMDSPKYSDRTAIIFFLFAFGKPCWNHDLKGWIKHEQAKKARHNVTKTNLNQPSQAHC